MDRGFSVKLSLYLNILNFIIQKCTFQNPYTFLKRRVPRIPCPEFVCPTINADIVIETIKLVIRIRRQCPYRHRIPKRYSCNPLIKRERHGLMGLLQT